MLDQIKIASPCTADWEQMQGTDQVRFCGECKKNVYNLSALSRRDAEALLKEKKGEVVMIDPQPQPVQLLSRSDLSALPSRDAQATPQRAKSQAWWRRLFSR